MVAKLRYDYCHVAAMHAPQKMGSGREPLRTEFALLELAVAGCTSVCERIAWTHRPPFLLTLAFCIQASGFRPELSRNGSASIKYTSRRFGADSPATPGPNHYLPQKETATNRSALPVSSTKCGLSFEVCAQHKCLSSASHWASLTSMRDQQRCRQQAFLPR